MTDTRIRELATKAMTDYYGHPVYRLDTCIAAVLRIAVAEATAAKNAEIERLKTNVESRVSELEGLLRRVEWSGVRIVAGELLSPKRYCCPLCDYATPTHGPDCCLAAALRTPEALEKTKETKQ